MGKSISILDKEYGQWLKELSGRYRRAQIKAAVKVNTEMLRFYWSLGRDIVQRDAENVYGSRFYASLSKDLQEMMPDVSGLSERNIRYTKKFYLLYKTFLEKLQQLAAKSEEPNLQQLAANSTTEVVSVATMMHHDLFSVPWGHHMLLIDKFFDNPEKALFYVRQTVENGWSRDVMLNFIDSQLYERQGKALTNFTRTLPDEMSDLAQELTKDPYDFAFTGIAGRYNERVLKDALLGNITRFLIELGTGFAYVGKEYRLQIGDKEKFIDLLFYNLKLSCYVVVEVKIGDFDFPDAGQLSGYVVACNHILRKEGRDNPTIGLLICKRKDKLLAQYALEGSNLPLGISEYDLERLYPEKVEGTIPTIEEIEAKLTERLEADAKK